MFKDLNKHYFQKAWFTLIGLGQLSSTPETEGDIFPMPTAVHFIYENICILFLEHILPAFSSNTHSPPNAGDRRMVSLVISVCKLRDPSVFRPGSRLGLNGSFKAAGSLTCLSARWVKQPLGSGQRRFFYFTLSSERAFTKLPVNDSWSLHLSFSAFAVCSSRSEMETQQSPAP